VLDQSSIPAVPVRAEDRIRLYDGAGALVHLLGDQERGAALYEQALSLKGEIGDLSGVAASISNLGMMAPYRGEFDRAAALFEEALSNGRSTGNRWGVAPALNNLGLTRTDQGRFIEARGTRRRAPALHRVRR
jgi:tetratricopeptide (TPR) repeat protein